VWLLGIYIRVVYCWVLGLALWLLVGYKTAENNQV
jgi:hypothetical protein